MMDKLKNEGDVRVFKFIGRTKDGNDTAILVTSELLCDMFRRQRDVTIDLEAVEFITRES